MTGNVNADGPLRDTSSFNRPLNSCRLVVWGTSVLALSFAIQFLPDAAIASDADAVDAAIVFAVDQSSSIGPDAAHLQLHGHVEALRSAEVIQAIGRGAIGCIAISYVEWSSVGRLETLLPWTRVCSAFDASDAADTILRTGGNGIERRRHGRTSISFAIDAAGLMLDKYSGQAVRRIIDISTNGTNNDGLPVAHSRARALEAGYIINGIAVRLDEPGVTEDLPGYLTDNVIVGAGAFVIAPDKLDGYASAIRRKLVLEISSRQDGGEETVRQASNALRIVR